jgi:hypothetical protein
MSGDSEVRVNIPQDKDRFAQELHGALFVVFKEWHGKQIAAASPYILVL